LQQRDEVAVEFVELIEARWSHRFKVKVERKRSPHAASR
jgi:hypothetical protein